jgi:hypothetical protein
LYYIITKFSYGDAKLAEMEKNFKPDPEIDPEA